MAIPNGGSVWPQALVLAVLVVERIGPWVSLPVVPGSNLTSRWHSSYSCGFRIGSHLWRTLPLREGSSCIVIDRESSHNKPLEKRIDFLCGFLAGFQISIASKSHLEVIWCLEFICDIDFICLCLLIDHPHLSYGWQVIFWWLVSSTALSNI